VKLQKLLALYQEDALTTTLEVEPEKRQVGETALQLRRRVAHFHDQNTALVEIIGGVAQYTQNQIQTALATGQPELRLLAKLLG
jgi:hypothetical protein